MFQTYIYQPILAVLVFIYNSVAAQDLGFAIILLTIVVRVVLLPLFYKGAKDQALMQRLQPRIEEIQREHKADKEQQAKALMALYKEHKLNPFSSIFLLILQLPIFFALFQIFSRELAGTVFATHTLLGFVDLSAKSIPIILIAAALQYLQGKLSIPPKTTPAKSSAAAVGKVMIIVGPILTVVVLMNLPAALGLYWLISTLFSVVQQVYINRAMDRQTADPKDKRKRIKDI
ncbi:MAG: YidC/Oxa1 family membrane protein insertase [bacterium]|nr:YidC/Oxa1 family membrane protein insertase [bacterium]